MASQSFSQACPLSSNLSLSFIIVVSFPQTIREIKLKILKYINLLKRLKIEGFIKINVQKLFEARVVLNASNYGGHLPFVL